MFGKTLKDLWVILCECGEDLAVESDLAFLQCAYEFRVGKTVFAGGCIDAQGEKAAEIALLGAAMPEGVRTCMMDGLFGYALLGLAPEAIALGLGKDILAALILGCASFYACHRLIEKTCLI